MKLKAQNDRVLEALERWKKWTIAIFAWLAVLIAVAITLTIELGAVKRVWGEVFSSAFVGRTNFNTPHIRSG